MMSPCDDLNLCECCMVVKSLQQSDGKKVCTYYKNGTNMAWIFHSYERKFYVVKCNYYEGVLNDIEISE